MLSPWSPILKVPRTTLWEICPTRPRGAPALALLPEIFHLTPLAWYSPNDRLWGVRIRHNLHLQYGSAFVKDLNMSLIFALLVKITYPQYVNNMETGRLSRQTRQYHNTKEHKDQFNSNSTHSSHQRYNDPSPWNFKERDTGSQPLNSPITKAWDKLSRNLCR